MANLTEKTGSEKYQKILEAATKVFCQKGFYNAKVADVAKVAQVADGTIYLYFKNKDDLLIRLFEESMDFFIAEIKKSLARVQGAEAKLRCFIALHLDLVRDKQDRAQVLQVELRQSSKFMKEYAGGKFGEYLESIAGILQEGKQEGVFRSDINVLIVSRTLFGAIDEMALEWVLMKKKKYSAEEVVTQLSELFIKGLKL